MRILLALFCGLTVSAISMTTTTTTIPRVDMVDKGGFAAGVHLNTMDVPLPIPGDGEEVLIDVKASAVNPVDWKMAEMGILLPNDGSPVALGCDVAGIVIAPDSSPLLGKMVVTYLGASKIQSGVTRGAYVDKVCADSDLVFQIPSDGSMTASQAATYPVGALTAQLLIEEVGKSAKRGEWILIWGTSSSVGWYTIQLAKQVGYKVIAVASKKHEASAMEFGADCFVDYRTQDVAKVVTETVRASSGVPMNAVADCIGSDDTFETCGKLLLALGNYNDGDRMLATTMPWGPSPPSGVARGGVDLGTATTAKREWLKKKFPAILKLKPQPLHAVSGPVTAETVEKAFQINKDGVSGVKVIIEWTK